jgi:uncharacterized membrane protein YfcA
MSAEALNGELVVAVFLGAIAGGVVLASLVFDRIDPHAFRSAFGAFLPGAHRVMWQYLPIALPPLLPGTLLGLHLFSKVGDGRFRKAICGLLSFSGIALPR